MPSTLLIGATIAFALVVSTMAHADQAPSNTGAVAILPADQSRFDIRYDGHLILGGRLSVTPNSKIYLKSNLEQGNAGEITQRWTLFTHDGATLKLDGEVTGSSEAFAAELDSAAQQTFKMVRNSVGPANNLRNNAIYDRNRDWVLSNPDNGSTRIQFESNRAGKNIYRWSAMGKEISIHFRPLYYQKHKNLTYFQPWNYSVWKGSVTGWCSWWAYFSDVHETDVEKISHIFGSKLKDYGYDTIQIDDGYQSSNGGLPENWLNTNEKFPSGLGHLSQVISKDGLKPALWLNVHFGDEAFVKQHLDWFIQDKDGKAHKGPWIDYGLDGSNALALDTVVRPTYRKLSSMGWKYFKVDALRHLLYDSSYPSRDYFDKKKIKLEDAYRSYLNAIRNEIGNDKYMLACWGVLPEAIGIANGCRLGGDGFGPSTLQQYTSWNNVVWRNDPDHCDIKPNDHKSGKTLDGEERIRPVLVSMAGAQLLLSDKPEVYENDANLEGVKRSSPILFTLPGQLNDYDPTKTDNLKKGLRNTKGGADSGPIDADQRGEVCPWWMLDIAQPYESWTVLTHMNWHDKPMNQEDVKFADLGLEDTQYSVFEFWSKKYLGDYKGQFTAKSVDPKDVSVYSIRKTLNHPQILSTSRHISQGAVDLFNVNWNEKGLKLCGTSHVIRKDKYSLYLRVPEGYDIKSAVVSGYRPDIRVDDRLTEVSIMPDKTGDTTWQIEFVHKP